MIGGGALPNEIGLDGGRDRSPDFLALKNTDARDRWLEMKLETEYTF